jgi:predicted glycosyltransferase
VEDECNDDLRTAPGRADAGVSYSIMIYCGDVLGLGHLRRNTAIASRFVNDLPGSNALLLTSLPAGDFFECPEGVDIVKLPSLRRTADGRMVGRKLTLDQGHLQELRTTVIRSVARSFRPDLFLVDQLPTGVWGELTPVLRDLKGCDPAPTIVLGLRDILDDPEVTRARWRRQGVYRTLNRAYDSVLIYGSRQIFDSRAQYGLDGQIDTDVTYCGYVCAEGPTVGSKLTRRELGLGDGRLLVITAGGGADGYSMIKLCLDALSRMPGQRDLEVACITGPLMRRDEIQDLRARSAQLPVRVFWCVEQAPVYFETADLIVSMAGYNTLVEAIRLGKKVLAIPRLGPSAEQGMRADVFSRLGVVRAVGSRERSPKAMARLIETMLGANAPTPGLLDMGGLDDVVGRLKTLLAARSTGRALRKIVGGR